MKDQEQYLRSLSRQGYIIRVGVRTHHLQIYDPAGHLVATGSGSPSDWRSLKNLRAQIRRHRCPAVPAAS